MATLFEDITELYNKDVLTDEDKKRFRELMDFSATGDEKDINEVNFTLHPWIF
jgi:hypothetical protein